MAHDHMECPARVQNSLMILEERLSAALGAGLDPSGLPWAQLTPEHLRAERSSIKWRRFAPDVLPMFVAEMDFAVAPEVRGALRRAIEASDIGYIDGPGELSPAFASFAKQRWGWEVPPAHIHLATDVATAVVEGLRVFRPNGGRLVLPTPTYPGFFEMLQEIPFEVIEVPLLLGSGPATLDLARIEDEFARGANSFVLCNPHNPHGVPFHREELSALADLAARYDVFVMSDEIHAPLTHRGATFHPFAPIAAAAGALAATGTSASKGWNIAGAKCAMLIAADERANEVLQHLPPEVITRTSILGLHASIAAFTEGVDWLDRAITQIEANQSLFTALVEQRLPDIGYLPGSAGYIAWLDLRQAGLGDRPAKRILDDAKVALNDGRFFGAGGNGFARLNLAAAPETIVRGVDRIASLIDSTRKSHS